MIRIIYFTTKEVKNSNKIEVFNLTDFDTIVVGGGIGGLGIATQLQNRGYDTLILEKEDKLGGRGKSINWNGWTLDMGLHLVSLGEGGTLHELCEKVGAEIEWAKYSEDVNIRHENEWIEAKRLLSSRESREEIKKIITEISKLSDSEIDNLDDVSWKQWIEKKVESPELKHMLSVFGMIVTTIVDPNEMAASEILWVFRRSIRNRNQLLAAAYPKGGWRSIIEKLKKVFEKEGGEIKTGTYVDEIKIEDDEATGADIQKKSKLQTEFETRDLEFISANRVVCSVPLWNLPEIMDMDKMPDWWTQRIMNIRFETTGYFGYIIGLPNQIFDYAHFMGAMETKHVDLPFQAFSSSNFDESVAPDDKMLMYCGCPVEYREMKKFRLKKMYDLMWKDVKEFFPQLEDIEFKIKFRTAVGCDGLARKPSLVGDYKPDVKAPLVKNLHFAGDTYRGRGLAVNSAASSALLCAESILGEEKD